LFASIYIHKPVSFLLLSFYLSPSIHLFVDYHTFKLHLLLVDPLLSPVLLGLLLQARQKCLFANLLLPPGAAIEQEEEEREKKTPLSPPPKISSSFFGYLSFLFRLFFFLLRLEPIQKQISHIYDIE